MTSEASEQVIHDLQIQLETSAIVEPEYPHVAAPTLWHSASLGIRGKG